VIFNIRGSTVTAEMGLIALEIDGNERKQSPSDRLAKVKGVDVEPIEKNV